MLDGMAAPGAKAPTASATNSTAPEPSEKPRILTAPAMWPSAMVANSASIGWAVRKSANSVIRWISRRSFSNLEYCERYPAVAGGWPCVQVGRARYPDAQRHHCRYTGLQSCSPGRHGLHLR